MRYTVYLRRTPENKVYIGCTSVSLERRQVLGYAETRFQEAIDKFGWDCIVSEILATTSDLDEAKTLKSKYIEQYQATNPDFGYNTIDSGYSMTPRRIEQLKQSTHNYWEQDEYREKSLAVRHSDEYKQAVSRGIRRKWKNSDYRKRVSESMRLQLANPEERAKRVVKLTQVWSNPEKRAAHSKLMREVMRRPDVHANLVASRKKIDWYSEAMKAGRKACGDANRGRISIHRTIEGHIENKRVEPSDLDAALAAGWELGWVTAGPGIAISKFEGDKLIKARCKSDELNIKLEQGWKRGWKG